MRKEGKILVVGGAGFLGQELIARLLLHGYEDILAVGRNEGNLVSLKEKFPAVEILPGDIADPFICAKACDGAETVLHLAAFKHVTLAEQNVYECMKSNIIGTMNLLEQTRIKAPAEFVFISTDKASKLRGVYGVSKYVGEKLILEYSRINPATQYRIIRYGNVWQSTGSFITKWEPLIRAGKEVVLTEPDATRFFFTVSEAVDLIFDALANGTDAHPRIPKIKGVSMGTVLECCQEVWGECPVRIIGLQEGENMHETMDGKLFSNEVEQYTKEEFKANFLCPTK